LCIYPLVVANTSFYLTAKLPILLANERRATSLTCFL